MGTYSKGILGDFRGKVGAVIGSKWRGVHYMRSKGSPRTGGFSQKQLEQQARFALSTRFLQPLHPVLRIGYQTQARTGTAINGALSDVMRDVVGGVFPDFTLNYPAFRIAKGTLLSVYQPTVEVEAGNIRFRWVYQSQQAGGSGDDMAIVVALAESGETTYLLQQSRRMDQTALLALPLVGTSTTVHCYVAMVSAGGRDVSNSVYAGALPIVV